METLGFWNYVKIDQNNYYIPQFDKKEYAELEQDQEVSKDGEGEEEKNNENEENVSISQRRRNNNIDEIIDERNQKIEKKQDSFWNRMKIRLFNFFVRILPNYLPENHEIIDIDGYKLFLI